MKSSAAHKGDGKHLGKWVPRVPRWPLAAGLLSHKKSCSNTSRRQRGTRTPGRSRLLKFNLFFSVFFWLQRYFSLSARARRCRSLLLHPWAKGIGGEVTAVSRRTKKGDLTCAGARRPEHGHVLGPPLWGWRWPRWQARCLAALLNAGGKPAARLPLGRFQGEDFEHTTSKGMKGEGSDGYQETGLTTLKESSPPLRLWLHPALIHFLSIFPFISPLLLAHDEGIDTGASDAEACSAR